jgi:hypothetical protein
MFQKDWIMISHLYNIKYRMGRDAGGESDD